MTIWRAKWTLLVVLAASSALNAYLAHRLTETGALPPTPAGAFVEYRPVFFDPSGGGSVEEGYHVDRSALAPAHLEKVRVVMDHGDLPYRFEDGRLLVPSELWEDKNVMRNVTSAAMNWYWLVFYAGYEGDRRATWKDASALRVKEQMQAFQERNIGAPSP